MYTMTNEDDEPNSHDFQESSYQQHLDQTIDLNEAVRTKDKAKVPEIEETNQCKPKMPVQDAKFKEISKPKNLKKVLE